MDDPIVAFLRARLDDLELAAKIASVDDAWGELRRMIPAEPGTLNRNYRLMHEASPARVLREVAAMREILTAYIKIEADGFRGDGWIALRFAVETLAGVWDGHPDYRQEWKP